MEKKKLDATSQFKQLLKVLNSDKQALLVKYQCSLVNVGIGIVFPLSTSRGLLITFNGMVDQLIDSKSWT